MNTLLMPKKLERLLSTNRQTGLVRVFVGRGLEVDAAARVSQGVTRCMCGVLSPRQAPTLGACVPPAGARLKTTANASDLTASKRCRHSAAYLRLLPHATLEFGLRGSVRTWRVVL